MQSHMTELPAINLGGGMVLPFRSKKSYFLTPNLSLTQGGCALCSWNVTL